MLRLSGRGLAIVIVVVVAVVLVRHGRSDAADPDRAAAPTMRPSAAAPADSTTASGSTVGSDSLASSPAGEKRGGGPEEGDESEHPPAGAPPAAEIAQAKTVAARYIEKLLTYGYPDRHVNDFIARATPYMTAGLADSWGATAVENTDGGPEWTRLTEQRLRHVTDVDDTVITTWAGRSKLIVTTVFRSGDLTPGQSLSGSESRREAAVVVVRTNAGWRASGHTMPEPRLG